MKVDSVRQYRQLLMEGLIPFWSKHGVDREHGGVLSCMREDGTVLSTDKYIWSQARFVWTCAALYNRVEPRPEFLERARETIDFLLRHGRDKSGRWVYRTTREGVVLEGATSIYSDCFVVYGLSEYCRAVSAPELLDVARDTFRGIRKRVEEPDFSETAPYRLPPNRRNHGVPMILTEVAHELAKTTADPEIAAAAGEYARRVMSHFVRSQRQCLLEYLDYGYREVAGPEGTFVMPGHAIESMWFVIHWALGHGDRDMALRACEVIRWHLEKGWDAEYGGLFLGVDADGGEPFQPNSDKKLWWPHCEALYATLLAGELTGAEWCRKWYRRVHEWAFAHFPMEETGEWWQRLDRRGNRSTELVALPVKDPFHLPRAVILILRLLEDGLDGVLGQAKAPVSEMNTGAKVRGKRRTR
ncbi:MAG TPA: AGE family epimerase/isomerase [Bryobacteraceae bacterium]|jgi:N-acylglucosamine 2-epimerase|nr:AGE family epimerase/isomerase [Bryobacteraceae bacterium]